MASSSSDAGGLRRADLYRRKIDLYAVLGVEKGATASQITKAYRALALRCVGCMCVPWGVCAGTDAGMGSSAAAGPIQPVIPSSPSFCLAWPPPLHPTHQHTKPYPNTENRYHPDRNVGNGSAEAAEKFKEISTAYAILSDPNKRRQYDLAGADAQSMFENGMESVDLENLNSAMRAFGALMTKLGVPIPTQVGMCGGLGRDEV